MKWKRNKLLAWLVAHRWLSFSPSNCILFWMTRNDCMWRGNGLTHWNANWFVVLFCREWVFGEPLQSSTVYNLQWSLAIQQPSITKWVVSEKLDENDSLTIRWAPPLNRDWPIVALATISIVWRVYFSRFSKTKTCSYLFLLKSGSTLLIASIILWGYRLHKPKKNPVPNAIRV